MAGHISSRELEADLVAYIRFRFNELGGPGSDLPDAVSPNLAEILAALGRAPPTIAERVLAEVEQALRAWERRITGSHQGQLRAEGLEPGA